MAADARGTGTARSEQVRAVDADGDGVLTFNEVMTYKMRAFRAADKNNDDALSFDEIVESVRAEQ